MHGEQPRRDSRVERDIHVIAVPADSADIQVGNIWIADINHRFSDRKAGQLFGNELTGKTGTFALFAFRRSGRYFDGPGLWTKY
ncbi:hypothetical protein ABIF44_002940 [Bradyrhizobium japonicum]|nr:hypothetical protein CF64_03200 [Bradyrhizobium japonicum]MCS3542059.1 hypothetical protein [Bradyrhizobium japonicum]MCS3990754.1 hypothetical protein [Bradyrhizobium japonicum]MCS4014435.1 hypothetical protein [Bradyrhizobium japonicum]MCS4210441.1 hypothetical protein [Bradyrhizobium japonicum]